MSDDDGTEAVTLDELLDQHFDARALYLRVAMPARVVSYNAASATVTVAIPSTLMLPDGNGNYVAEELPNVQDVPVAWQRCGKFSITFPLVAGDGGLILCADVNLGAWRIAAGKNEPIDPGDLGVHTIDGAVFLPGVTDDAHAPQHADASNMVVGSETDGPSRIEIKPSGGINLGAGATKGVIRTNDTITASAELAAWALLIEAACAASGHTITTLFASISGAGAAGKLGSNTGGSASIKAVD